MNDTMHEKMAGLSRMKIDGAQRPAQGNRTWLLLAAVFVVVGAISAGAAWWYYSTTGVNIAAALTEKPAEVNVLIVPGRSAAAEQVVMVANGRIVSDRFVNVATKVSGQITELNVEQGDRVEQGQVLARVEDIIYKAQRDEAVARVAGAEQQVVRAEADEQRARAAIAQAQADFELRRRDLQRITPLFENGRATEFELRNARNLDEGAEAALRVAEAVAKSAAADVQQATTSVQAASAVLRIWQKRLDDCAIKAPISGVILQRNAQVGDFLAAEGGLGANANAQLVSIADMSLLRVEVDVSERDIHRVFAGQPAKITPDADRATYRGAVMWVDPVGDYARATVQVKVRIEQPGPKLCVDGSAKVEFLAEKTAASTAVAPPTLWLPKAAVKLTPGSEEALVFTVTDGRAVAHPILLGTRADESVEVRSGVTAGMQLICEDLDNIAAGSPIKVVRTVSMDEL